MDKKIAVIGDRESILCFQAVGFHTEETSDPHTTKKLLRSLAQEDYGLLFITEQAYLALGDECREWKTSPFPAIIPIPSKDEPLGVGIRENKEAIQRAVGADLFAE